MIGFKMDVNSLVVDKSDISSAQTLLSRAYRFGSLYLRSSRTIRGRGLRVFKVRVLTHVIVYAQMGYTLEKAV